MPSSSPPTKSFTMHTSTATLHLGCNVWFHSLLRCGNFKANSEDGFLVVVKEREMEIGLPTDVKHVAHIGWDGPSGSAPTWMNEFKTGPDFAATSIGNSGSALSPWSSQDFGESTGQNSTSDVPPTELPSIPKAKQKRKKIKSTSSPRSTSSSTSRSSRAAKSKAKFVEDNPNPPNIEVA